MHWIGLTLVVAGLALRTWALHHLYRAGLDNHHIFQVLRPPTWTYEGPYRYLNHPAYVGSMLTIAGIGWTAFGPWGVVLSVPALPYFAARAEQESRLRLEDL